MRVTDPSSKALVFSQYNSTLEWLQRRLPEEGFSFRTITGSMAQRKRARAIEAFQSDPPTTVFLLSMRSGAVGINLTAASHVYLLEPCLNPALEEQAIGRAWRMGQQRKVTVKRFYVKVSSRGSSSVLNLLLFPCSCLSGLECDRCA
ncbi:P-loop containing nucleoside triphosphate hydrolase protein [Scenedesmus sp. NREL 46B-D3]|nr:P-loop containing nucleoside triphosphate hydrolase protein [Scenedesmus sp. NREL 46B-D3]